MYKNKIIPLIRKTRLIICMKVPAKEDLNISNVQIKTPDFADITK